MSEKTLLLVASLGNEEKYVRQPYEIGGKVSEKFEVLGLLHVIKSVMYGICLLCFSHNDRNFLRMAGREVPRQKWTVQIVSHDKQQDSSSCGILVLKVKISVFPVISFSYIYPVMCN